MSVSNIVKSPTYWRKNEQINHAKFGLGIIINVEKADGEDYHITALFKNGKKTLLSSFLKKN